MNTKSRQAGRADGGRAFERAPAGVDRGEFESRSVCYGLSMGIYRCPEKGLPGNPRSIATLIRSLEMALREAMQSWREYTALGRKSGAVVQFRQNDNRQPALDGIHSERDIWWRELGKEQPELVIPPDIPPKPQLGRVPPPVPLEPPHLRRI